MTIYTLKILWSKDYVEVNYVYTTTDSHGHGPYGIASYNWNNMTLRSGWSYDLVRGEAHKDLLI